MYVHPVQLCYLGNYSRGRDKGVGALIQMYANITEIVLYIPP
jgi:hypothetical protein